MSFLKEVIKSKKSELEKSKKLLPITKLKSKLKKSELDFKSSISKNGLNIIAEIKKASPSEGIIRKEFNHLEIAKIYAECPVSAISVLTEKKYFSGSIFFLSDIRNVVNIPLLRKDFIIDEYQIYESRHYGADAILLILTILGDNTIRRFISLAKKYSMACLVEAHNEEEVKRAIVCGADIIGINNRDLSTLRMDKSTAERLVKLIPRDKTIVAESGYETKEEIIKLKGNVNAVIIGSSLMRAVDIKRQLKELINRIYTT